MTLKFRYVVLKKVLNVSTKNELLKINRLFVMCFIKCLTESFATEFSTVF